MRSRPRATRSLVLLLEKAWRRFAAGSGIDGPSLVALVLFVLALALVVEAFRAFRLHSERPPVAA